MEEIGALFTNFSTDWLTINVTYDEAREWCWEWLTYFDSFSDEKLASWPLMSSPVGPATILSIYFLIVYYGNHYLTVREERRDKIIKHVAFQNVDDIIEDDDEEDDEENNDNKDKEKDKKDDEKTAEKSAEKSTEKPAEKVEESSEKVEESTKRKPEIPCKIAEYRIFTLMLFLYNISISLLNGWIAYELIYNGIENEYNFLCQLVYPYVDDEHENRIAIAMWWYWASKGIELLDTLFILLKGKTSQLTFLHIYHHSSMFAVWWVGAKFVPGGSALSGASVNCMVHVLMYFYYALSSISCFRPALQAWKRRLTIVQIVQFSLGIVLGLNSIFTGCAFTRWMQYVFVAYAGSFLVLFSRFYARTYLKKRSQNPQNIPQNPENIPETHKKSE